MSGLSRDSPTNRGYYAESSQVRALTISDLGHPLHITYVLQHINGTLAASSVFAMRLTITSAWSRMRPREQQA
jgi:hypothetical protein